METPHYIMQHNTHNTELAQHVCHLETKKGSAPRWHIDADTLAMLEAVFKTQRFPDVETRNTLGRALSVSQRQIQVWFQNRRQRERKQNEALSSSSLSSELTMPLHGSSSEFLDATHAYSNSKQADVELPLARIPSMMQPCAGSGLVDSQPFTISLGSLGSLANNCDNVQAPPEPRTAATATFDTLLLDPFNTHSPELVPLDGLDQPPPMPTPLAPPLTSFRSGFPESDLRIRQQLSGNCKSMLLGQTIKLYGDIVQVILGPAPQCTLLAVSAGWQRLTGHLRDGALGRPLSLLDGPDSQPEALAAIANAFATGSHVCVRITSYTAAGESFDHELCIEPLRDPMGNVRCYQGSSLVLRTPGRPAIAHLEDRAPLVSDDALPPLWPVLGRAVHPRTAQRTNDALFEVVSSMDTVPNVLEAGLEGANLEYERQEYLSWLKSE